MIAYYSTCFVLVLLSKYTNSQTARIEGTLKYRIPM